jgi:hypothetical protein
MSKRTEKYGHKLQNVKDRVKDAEQGLVEAVFSTFNVIDSDGDVLESLINLKSHTCRPPVRPHISGGVAVP